MSGLGEFVWVADHIQNVRDVFVGKIDIELCFCVVYVSISRVFVGSWCFGVFQAILGGAPDHENYGI